MDSSRGNDVSRPSRANAWTFGQMLFWAAVSLLASFVLSVDAIELARDPAASLSCDINAVISCGQVGLSWQASLFGFPNAFLGLITESVVITVAVAGLSGVRFPRWFMFAAQVGYTLGLVFAYWMFEQSLFVIHVLCPWCMVIYLSTTLVFWHLTRYNIREGNLFLPAGPSRRAQEFVRSGNDVYAVAAWIILLVALVVAKYGTAILG
ncbi:MAG: vitamin K epoxide reductase family protein [Cellulomonas sp.]